MRRSRGNNQQQFILEFTNTSGIRNLWTHGPAVILGAQSSEAIHINLVLTATYEASRIVLVAFDYSLQGTA